MLFYFLTYSYDFVGFFNSFFFTKGTDNQKLFSHKRVLHERKEQVTIKIEIYKLEIYIYICVWNVCVNVFECKML